MDNLMKTLKVEIDREFSRAARALGLNDKIMKLRKEISIRNPKNQPLQPALKAKVDKLKKDFMKIVNAHPRYGILKYKFYLLQTIPELKKYYEARMKSAAIMSEIYERYRDVVRRPDIKQRIYAIKDEIEKSGASSEEELSEELKGKIMEVRKELGSELVNIVKSLGFKTSKSGLNVRRLQLKKEIDKVVEETVKSTKMKGVFRVLNKMVAKARKNPDLETKKKIKIVKRKIKKRVVEAIKKSGLIEKRNRLLAENNGEVDVGSKGSPIDVTFEELNVPSLLGEKVRAK